VTRYQLVFYKKNLPMHLSDKFSSQSIKPHIEYVNKRMHFTGNVNFICIGKLYVFQFKVSCVQLFFSFTLDVLCRTMPDSYSQACLRCFFYKEQKIVSE